MREQNYETASLPDTFINEVTSLSVHSITTIDIIPVPQVLTKRMLQKSTWALEEEKN